MEEIIKKAIELSQSCKNQIMDDQILDASETFTKLTNLTTLVQTLAHEIDLIKLASEANIINYLKRLRYEIKILESPLSTIDDIQRLNKKPGNKEIVPGITLASTSVPDENFIPDMPLYYIESSNTWAIKVNGVLIKGPGIREPDEKGFESGNWIYTKEPLNSKNKYMRHIGSPKNLKLEISNATRVEKELRLKQLSHDLLINLAIQGQGRGN